MRGLQLTADLHGCAAARAAMTDPQALRALCVDAVRAAGLTPVRELFHRFEPALAGAPAGITGVVLLAESHVAVHTWPELAAATLDVYVCNFGADNSAKAHDLLERLIAVFGAREVVRRNLERGAVPERLAATSEARGRATARAA
jgi:S-adenosylmethionine decarboxylase proenzyme